MLTAVLKAVKMLLSCCLKNSQDAAVLSALKAVQDVEKKPPPQRPSTETYSINLYIPGLRMCNMHVVLPWFTLSAPWHCLGLLPFLQHCRTMIAAILTIVQI
jgi:hypothetical protein